MKLTEIYLISIKSGIISFGMTFVLGLIGFVFFEINIKKSELFLIPFVVFCVVFIFSLLLGCYYKKKWR